MAASGTHTVRENKGGARSLTATGRGRVCPIIQRVPRRGTAGSRPQPSIMGATVVIQHTLCQDMELGMRVESR